MIALFHWFVKLTGFLPQLFVFRTKVLYEDKARQSRRIRGKAIVVSNHHSVFDVALMMFLFPFRTLRCVVAELMYEKNAFMTLFLHLLGGIKVEREARDFSFISRCTRILERGGVVEIYPEARIPKQGEERPLPFKPSAVYLALESGAPIIPVYHNGALISRRRACAKIGAPINVRAMYDDTRSQKENIEAINTYLREKVIELGKEVDEYGN